MCRCRCIAILILSPPPQMREILAEEIVIKLERDHALYPVWFRNRTESGSSFDLMELGTKGLLMG